MYSLTNIFAEFKRSMRLSFPLVISELTYGSSSLAATGMVARLGRDELAAGVLVWGIFVTLILFFVGILHALGVMVAHSYGAKDNNGVRTTLFQGVILSFVFALPMMLIIWFAPKILYWSGQDPEIIKISIPYFHALAWCMLPLNLSFTIEQFLIGIALTRIVTLTSFFRVALDIVFFYLLILGKFGMPKLGLAGIGYALTIAMTITVLVQAVYLYYSPRISQYKLFSVALKLNKKYIAEIIRIGFPMGFMYCLEVALITVATFFMGWLGKNMLAAHQIAHQCFMFAITAIFGVGQGATIRVGHEVGRNNKNALKLAAFVNLGIGLGLMIIASIFYFWWSRSIIILYMGEKALQHPVILRYAAQFLSIAAVLQLTECIRLISLNILRGLKDTKVPLYISMVAFWLVAFPSSYLLAFTFHMKGAGIWWGLVIGLAFAAIILFFRFIRLVKRIDLAALVTK